MALWRARDKPPVELVVANLEKYSMLNILQGLKNGGFWDEWGMVID